MLLETHAYLEFLGYIQTWKYINLLCILNKDSTVIRGKLQAFNNKTLEYKANFVKIYHYIFLGVGVLIGAELITMVMMAAVVLRRYLSLLIFIHCSVWLLMRSQSSSEFLSNSKLRDSFNKF